MNIRFSDGADIDTSGPYRIVEEQDGLYVAGKGLLYAVETREEGDDLIRKLSSKTKARPS